MDRLLCLIIRLLAYFSRFTEPLSRIGIGRFERWHPGEKVRVLLVGYNGARNTGSDVRVVSIAEQVRELFGADRVSITVMTLNEKTLEGYFDKDVTLLPFSSLYPWHLYRACSTHHAAILCEGSTLKSTFANALTLFLCEAAGIMAAQKKPCIAYGSEVGEMEPFLRRAAASLCRDTWFITRNEESLAALKALGLRGHAGTDAAWRYDGAISPEEAAALLREQGWDGKRPLLGIAVIDPFCWPVRASLSRWLRSILTGDRSGQYDLWYFFSDSPERRAAYRRYLSEIAAGAARFLKEYDFFPVIIGMEKLDEKACRDLLNRLERPAALFLSGGNDASRMTGILRSLSALVTSRYHASVLSMERACPIVAVSMDERLDCIMGDLSLEPFLFHIREEDLGDKICRALCAGTRDREQIRDRIGTQLVQYKKTLAEMGDFLRRYILDGLEAPGRTIITDPPAQNNQPKENL